MATGLEIATRAFEAQYKSLSSELLDVIMKEAEDVIRLKMGSWTIPIQLDLEVGGRARGTLIQALVVSKLEAMGFSVSVTDDDAETVLLTPMDTPPEGSLGLECQRASALAKMDPTSFYYEKFMKMIEPQLNALAYEPKLTVKLGCVCPESAMARVSDSLAARGFIVTLDDFKGYTFPPERDGNKMVRVMIRLSTTSYARAASELVERMKKQKMEVEEEVK